MGWFEKKLMFVSVVAALQSMSIARLGGFWFISRSKNLYVCCFFICRIDLYVCVCLTYVCIDEVRVCYFGVIYN